MSFLPTLQMLNVELRMMNKEVIPALNSIFKSFNFEILKFNQNEQ